MHTITIIFIIILPIICFVAGLVTGYYTCKPKMPTKLEITKLAIENLKFINKLNPFVVIVYKHFIDRYKIKYFKLDDYTLYISDLDISIWAANEAANRTFQNIPIPLLRAYNTNVYKVNESLTTVDKQVLDKIIKRIHDNNKEFINQVFIN